MSRFLTRITLVLATFVFIGLAAADNKVVVVPLAGDDLRSKPEIERCAWVSSSGCSLAGAAGSTCDESVSCPEGRVVTAGGCEGFTSVAIGRSSRSGTTQWRCFWRRIATIGNSNSIQAEAYCCDATDDD